MADFKRLSPQSELAAARQALWRVRVATWLAVPRSTQPCDGSRAHLSSVSNTACSEESMRDGPARAACAYMLERRLVVSSAAQLLNVMEQELLLQVDKPHV